ncbi:hypothetical protein NLG42_17460 [Flavobacterium plurextorum]|uniref:hypothetical protein n=1 Tax=Flavobacterium TaxID=237 RepID=UPI00214DDF28|nr:MULTISPECIES: hypothetical protein [Flavobacterium]UUW07882.1 hypothetical protein NLG42_17460 [Flavobacterium plurextorum]
MKAKAFIEIGNDGTYSVYIENNTLSYGIHGTGKTVKEAVEDFNSAYESMKEFYKEQNKNFTECEFDFFYDIASKEDLANTKTEMIKWLVGVFFALALMIIGLYFK